MGWVPAPGPAVRAPARTGAARDCSERNEVHRERVITTTAPVCPLRSTTLVAGHQAREVGEGHRVRGAVAGDDEVADHAGTHAAVGTPGGCHRSGVLDRRPRGVVGGARVAHHGEVLQPDRRHAEEGPLRLHGRSGWRGRGARPGGIRRRRSGGRAARGRGSGGSEAPPVRSRPRSSPRAAVSAPQPVRDSRATATIAAAVQLRRGLTPPTVRRPPERVVSPGRCRRVGRSRLGPRVR